MSKTREVIADAGSYSSALLLTQVVTVAASILTRRFLGPVNMGVWSYMQVFLSYAEYASLGTLAAITLQIPYLNGKGDTQKAERIKNIVFSFSILTSAILSAGILIYAIRFRTQMSRELFIGYCFLSALVILQRINGLFISLIRAFKQFSLAGRQMFYSAIVNALLIAVLAYQFKLYGFMMAMCLSFVFNIVYIQAHQKLRFGFDLEWSELGALIQYGGGLMIIAMLTTFFETIDRVMITKYLGFEALGLYGIGIMAFNYINSVPNAITIVTIPNLQEKYGQNEKKSDLKGFLEKSDFLMPGMIAVLIGLAWFLMPLLVESILPKFTRGIASMRYLILGTFFIAVGQAYLQIIYVVKQQMKIFYFTAASCAVAFLLNCLAIQRGLGIEGVAAATSTAIFFNFTLVRRYAADQIAADFLRDYLSLILKFVLMLATLLLLTNFVRTPFSIVTALLQSVVFVALHIPFFIESNKRFGLIDIFKQKLFKKGPANV